MMKRKLIIVLIWIIVVSLFVATVWIIDSKYKNNSCREIQIFINAPADTRFITEQDVRNYVEGINDSLVGDKIAKIDIEKVERVIGKIPFVQSSKVFISLGGVIKIYIIQRIPIARIQNVLNQCYYISEDGYLLPVVSGKTARILFANGHIFSSYINLFKLDLNPKVAGNDTSSISNDLIKIYKAANYIHNDPFWRAQIQQLFLDKNGNLLMTPLVGDHIINLGDTKEISDKFEKLRIFYRKKEFLASWDKYDTININYKGQIVCSKKITLKNN